MLIWHSAIDTGCDEAGCGPLAGSVVAAVVQLSSSFSHPLLRDSKKLSGHQRAKIEPEIINAAHAIGIGRASVEEIDRLNILEARFLAMHRAIDKFLNNVQPPKLLLIDGNRFNDYPNIKHKLIIRGDRIYAAIAASSIIAKEYRDREMKKIAKEYRFYGWESNKGYPTKKHREAIKKYGLTPYHRKTFCKNI